LETPQWNLQIITLNGTTTNLAYEDLLALAKITVTSGLYCYGNIVASGDWEGARLSDILNQAGVDPSVLSIDFRAKDGYSVSMPINMATRQDIIVAYELNGSPLPETLRLVVPGANGNSWISMITSISMSDSPLDASISTPVSLPSYVPNQTSSTTPTEQPLQQNQPQTQLQTPTNTSNKNPATDPTMPPANLTSPPSEQKVAGQYGSIQSVGVVYVLVISAVVGLVVFSVVFRRRKLRT
jgi:DMSO/TMAO reductase YedYZ molybdopterin-dependent catalytic subunit